MSYQPPADSHQPCVYGLEDVFHGVVRLGLKSVIIKHFDLLSVPAGTDGLWAIPHPHFYMCQVVLLFFHCKQQNHQSFKAIRGTFIYSTVLYGYIMTPVFQGVALLCSKSISVKQTINFFFNNLEIKSMKRRRESLFKRYYK